MVSAPDLLIFDMDGVLVDVTESFRETIRRTVEHFTGKVISGDLIQEFKNQGGWNDDWDLSFRLVRDAGIDVSYDAVVGRFQRFFRGDNGYNGLIQNEKWMARDGLFDRLALQYRLAIFTGRLHEEAEVTLRHFAPDLFDPVVGAEDVKAAKPAPDGILKIRSLVPHERVFYVGDTVDDARSAHGADTPFVGIVGPRTPRRAESIRVLERQGALAVLTSINELEETLRTL